MAVAAPPKQSNVTPALIGVGIVIILLAAGGWFLGREDTDLKETPEDHNVLITFEAAWGVMVDTGETYEDTGKPIRELYLDDHELVIDYYINDVQHRGDQYDSDTEDRNVWRHTTTVPVGSTVNLHVWQDEGWLICYIKEDELAVAIGTVEGPGVCEIEHIVFGMP